MSPRIQRFLKTLRKLALVIGGLSVVVAAGLAVAAMQNPDTYLALGEVSHPMSDVLAGNIPVHEYLVVAGALLLAGLVCVVVVPLALALGFGLPLLIVGAVGVLLASPLLAVVLLTWWLVRRSQRTPAA